MNYFDYYTKFSSKFDQVDVQFLSLPEEKKDINTCLKAVRRTPKLIVFMPKLLNKQEKEILWTQAILNDNSLFFELPQTDSNFYKKCLYIAVLNMGGIIEEAEKVNMSLKLSTEKDFNLTISYLVREKINKLILENPDSIITEDIINKQKNKPSYFIDLAKEISNGVINNVYKITVKAQQINLKNTEASVKQYQRAMSRIK